MTRMILLGFALILSANFLAAQQTDYAKYGILADDVNAPEGLQEGQPAPMFKAVDQHGEKQSLRKLLKEGPVVLLFYRGQWCPVCNRYLSGIQDSLSMIRDAGAQVVAVGPETPENLKKTVEKTGAEFLVLADQDDDIMERYDLRFQVTDSYAGKIKQYLGASIAENNDQETAMLPVPATYVIQPDGRIAYRQFDPNYKNRASVAEILEALQGIE